MRVDKKKILYGVLAVSVFLGVYNAMKLFQPSGKLNPTAEGNSIDRAIQKLKDGNVTIAN